MKKWVYVLVIFFVGFILNIDYVYGEDNVVGRDCGGTSTNVFTEQFIKWEYNENYGETEDDAEGSFDGGTYKLGEGESVCRRHKNEGASTSIITAYAASILKCDNSKTTEFFCDENEACITSTSANGKREAKCVNNTSCDKNIEGIGNVYYDTGGYPRSFTGKNPVKDIETDESACFGNVIKRCEAKTGNWVEVKTCSDESTVCTMKDGGGDGGEIFLKASCGKKCSVTVDDQTYYANFEQTICDPKTTKKLIKCNWWKGRFEDVDKSLTEYFGKTCDSCTQTPEGPKCATDVRLCNSLLLDDGSTESSALSGEDGTRVCNSALTEVYVCDSTATDAYEKGQFVLKEKCTEGKICGRGKDKTIGCITPEEAKQNDQTYVSVSVSTDTGFMCDSDTGVQTAFGCIPITASGLANKLLPILFGIAGGISFLRMVLGFIMIATSSGDEKKFIEAKSIISSAIIGLLVSIFAIFLFRLIFVNILQIPGLS